MLTNWNPARMPEKDEMKLRLSTARKQLYDLQMKIKEHKIPVIVLFEGWGTSGKGSTIGKVIRNIDPRFFKVVTMSEPTDEELRYPFLYRFFKEIPEAGKFTFLDSGWLEQICREHLEGKTDEKEYASRIESVRNFERQLTDNGYLVLKFFMQIEKKEQKEREQNLLESKDTKWRVSLFDQWENAHYKKCKKAFSKYMSDTNSSSAPWYIIDAGDQKWAELQVMETLVSNIEVALQNQAHSVPILQNVFPLEPIPRLADIDLQDKILNDEEYKKELKQLQIELENCTINFIGKGFRSSSHMKAGMQQEKAAISNELPRRLIQEVMRYNRLPDRNRMKKQDIICGVFGRDCQKAGILRYLTEPGTAE